MRLTNTPFLLALLLALVSTSLLATVEANLSWTTCGDAQDVLTVDQLTYTPEDPKRGDVLNVTATGALKEQLEEGVMAFLVVKWGFVRVPVPPVDLCKEIGKQPDAPQHCPVKAGPFTLSQSFQLPAEMPQGNYDVQIKIRTADKRQVTCISVKLSV